MAKQATNTRLLQNKGEFTKFQILLEIMRNQPHIKQKDISDKLGITIQAISKYFKKLSKEGLLESGSERADYRLTPKGVTKLREDMQGLESYVKEIKQELKIEHAWPAIATQPVKAGEEVGLIMKEGVMYTSPINNPQTQAKGIALADAQPGEDLGLKELHGKLHVNQGKILIVKLPSIRKGGSNATDMTKVQTYYDEFKPDRIGVMGAVGRAVLNKLGRKADIEFGISRSAAIAASRGLNVFVLVVGRMVNRMIQEIDQINMKSGGNIIYEVKDAQQLTQQ
ncbi:MAG: winged helix-turn-helix transcriptional regulator [Nitrososphaerota archaeon]|jgi:putative transcriptional regulator|nr:winged helix-turn-helix transcriptional regulator [Nitrososphaerota archaeon]